MKAPTFVPGRRPTKVSIKDPIEGVEIKTEDWGRGNPAPSPPHTSFDYLVNQRPIRLENEGANKKLIAEEEKQRKAEEADETAKQEEERKEGEEKERSSYKQEDPERETDRRGGEALFDLRGLDEAAACFSGLPSAYHERLVDQLVLKAIKSKDADAALVADFFGRAASNNLCSPASFEAGFIDVAEFLGVIAIDAPKAWDFMAMLITATGLDEVGQRRIASKTTDADRLLRNLCVDTSGAVEDSVQSLGNSRSTLSSFTSTSGSTLVNPSVCTEPHQKADAPQTHSSIANRAIPLRQYCLIRGNSTLAKSKNIDLGK
ncbi:ARM repeat-containing [Salix suchowensis]|nr:ARM repeat-containing [Salix suchowensis]